MAGQASKTKSNTVLLNTAPSKEKALNQFKVDLQPIIDKERDAAIALWGVVADNPGAFLEFAKYAVRIINANDERLRLEQSTRERCVQNVCAHG